MKNLVGYHSAEKMGYAFAEAKEPMAFSTKKPVEHLIGAKVWAIAGEGQPREYALGAWFIVDEVGASDDNPAERQVRGSIGDTFAPPLRLNDLPWFTRFRESQSNFSLGLQPINDEFVAHLEALVAVTHPHQQLPSSERYFQTFSELRQRLTDGQIAMLRAHLAAPGHSLTARQLADAAGYRSFRSANLQYGILGRLLREKLHYGAPGQQSYVFASFTQKEGAEWSWILHPAVVAALQRLDWIAVAASKAKGGAPSPRSSSHPITPPAEQAQRRQTGRSALKVVFSYSHLDDFHRDQLDGHLSVLKRLDLIDLWHDGRLIPGEDWGSAIREKLEQADIVVLLVSKDFLASDYCYSKEMHHALERHRSGSAVVIPVLVRACDWTLAPFAGIQALPPRAQPVTSWSNQDEAYAQVAIGIRACVESLRSKKGL